LERGGNNPTEGRENFDQGYDLHSGGIEGRLIKREENRNGSDSKEKKGKRNWETINLESKGRE